MRALAMRLPGNQEVRANGLHTLPMRSWIMNRPTRVPASTVVSMNRASNMMAKWYQNACRAAPKTPVTPAKIADIPTASVGAPPVRPTMESSPTALAVLWSVSGLTENPKPLTAWEAGWTVSPRSARLAVIGKYPPGVERDRGYHGHYGHKRLREHRAVADRAHLRLFLDQLGRGSRRDERMEARECSAGDNYEHEREQRAGEDRSLAVEGELREAGHVHRGQCYGYPDGE